MKLTLPIALRGALLSSLSGVASLGCVSVTGALSTGAILYCITASTMKAETLTDTTITEDAEYTSIAIEGAVIIAEGEESDTTLTSTGALTFVTGATLTIDADQELITNSLTLSSGSSTTNTIINNGTLSIGSESSTAATFSSSSSSSDTASVIENYGTLNLYSPKTVTLQSYNSIINYGEGTITFETSNFVIKTNSSVTNAGSGVIDIDNLKFNVAGTTGIVQNSGSGSMYIDTITYYSAGGIIQATAESTGKIIIGDITASVADAAVSNYGSGDIIISTASLGSTMSIGNYSSGVLAIGSLGMWGTVTMSNTSSGSLYIGSGSLSNNRTISNTGSGTLYIGTAYSYTDPVEDTSVTLALNEAESFSIASGSTISNSSAGTLSLDGTIVLGAEESIINYGDLILGETLVFDVSSLINESDFTCDIQIFSADSSADLSALTEANLTGYDSLGDDVSISFNNTGGVSISLSNVYIYNGSGGDVILSNLGLTTNQSVSFLNPDGQSDTATTLTVDTGAETSINMLKVDDNYTLTLGTESDTDALAIANLSLSSSSKLILTSGDISLNGLSATEGASITFGGSNQKYSIDVAVFATLKTGYTLEAGNTLNFTSTNEAGTVNIIYTGMDVYSGIDAEHATTIAIDDNVYVKANTNGLTFYDNGYVTFDIGDGATYYSNANMTINDSAAITFTKTGDGDLYLNYKIINTANSDLVIEAGSVTLDNTGTTFDTVTIKEGASFIFAPNTSLKWTYIATTALYLEGGTFKDTSGKSGNATESDFPTIILQGGYESTLDFSESSMTGLTFTEALQGSGATNEDGSRADDGTLVILGNNNLPFTFTSIENLNGTVDNSDGSAVVYVQQIDNDAGETTAFLGDIAASTLTKMGDGDVSFETLSASSQMSISGTGAMSISESLSIGNFTITAQADSADSGITPVLQGYSASTENNSNILISFTGVGDSGTMTTDSLIAVSLSNASVSASDDITLESVDLSNVAILASGSTVTLSNMGTVSESSITADDLVIVVSEGSGLMIAEALDGSLSYTITVLDGFTDLTIADSITLNLDLTDDQESEFFAAIGDGTSISIILDSALIENLSDTALSNVNIQFAEGYEVDLNGDGTIASGGSFNASVNLIPEPSTSTLSLLALAGLLARRRRRD